MKINSFFCGAGGFDLGFLQVGFDVVGAWDFDKYAIESYNHNIGGAIQSDVTKMTGKELPDADGWLFGFPCQDISIAGKQKGMIKGETRSGLFYEIMRLLGEVEDKPNWILAENVGAVKKYLPTIEEEYKKLGYKLIYQLNNSKYHRVPQNRSRYFMIGVREDVENTFVFPMENTENIPLLTIILEDEVEEKYYIDDLKAAKIIEQAVEGLRVKQATKKGYDVAVEGDSINISHPNSKTRRGRVGKQVAQTLLTGTEQVVVVKQPKLLETCKLSKQANKFEGFTEYSGTLLARDYKGFGNQEMDAVIENRLRVRKLTPREYARLQGFPDSYEQVVSNTQFYKQMGNAVTVNVAYDIAKAIKEQLY
jgi:DNA (cytosine-5)-methyltransferase 1